MTKDRKSVHVTAETHDAMIRHFEVLQKKAQKVADYKINPPNIEKWVSEAIMEKIERNSQK